MRDSEPTPPDERAARLDACLAISALCIELAKAGAAQRAPQPPAEPREIDRNDR